MSKITDPADQNDQPVRSDRYERLIEMAAAMAKRPNVFLIAADCDEEDLLDGEDLLAFADLIVEHRLLDGLTERDASTVSTLSLLDFLRGGPHRMAWRIHNWMNHDRSIADRKDDDELAITYALVGALYMLLGYLRGSISDEIGGSE